jgi:hypothetical protein
MAGVFLGGPTAALLADCRVGCEFPPARGLDQTPELLSLHSASGTCLWTRGRVGANRVEAGAVGGGATARRRRSAGLRGLEDEMPPQ